jgi:MFS transporter, ACDE family, multidrug resistance protein
MARDISTLRMLRNTNLQLLYASSLMAVMGSSLIYPILPIIRDSLQAPESQLGLVLSAFSLPTIFTAPLVGFLADLKGRKRIMVFCLLAYGLAGLSISFVKDFNTLLLLRVIQGLGYGGIMPLVVIIIGDTYIKAEETRAQGTKVFMDRIGMLCSPPLAGFLGAISWHAPFALYGLAIPIAFGIHRWLPESDIDRGSRLSPYFKEIFALASQLRLLVIFSISSLRFFLERAFFAYLPIFALHAAGLTVVKESFLFTIYGVGALITSSQLGDLALRYEKLKLVILAFFIQGLCLLATPWASGIWWLGLVMFIFGLANGLISPLHKSLLTQSAPGKLRGGVVSTDRVLENTCQTLSPIIAGLILALSNVEMVFYTLGILALIWVVVVLGLRRRGYLQPTQTEQANSNR